MTPDERIAEKAATAKRRLHSTLIAVTDRLDQPYPDRPELSPWTAFVRPMIDVVDSALDDLVAQLRDAQAENERLGKQLTGVHLMLSAQRDRADAAEARLAAAREWAMVNEIAAPPLDWAALGAALDAGTVTE